MLRQRPFRRMHQDTDPALSAIARPLRLTLLGLWAERVTRAFWPVWTVVAAMVPSFVLLALAGLYNAAHYWRLASDDVAGRRQEGGAA